MHSSDDARTVLVAMAKELGTTYMPFLCEVLSAALPDKGYTAHVLGHTVHALVEAMHKVSILLGAACGFQTRCLSEFVYFLVLSEGHECRLYGCIVRWFTGVGVSVYCSKLHWSLT